MERLTRSRYARSSLLDHRETRHDRDDTFLRDPVTGSRDQPPAPARLALSYHSHMTNPAPVDDIPIGSDGIRLGQFLKFAGLLDSGGNVKEAIADGFVTVNGEVDRRRGRQLQLGDIVAFEGRRVRVAP